MGQSSQNEYTQEGPGSQGYPSASLTGCWRSGDGLDIIMGESPEAGSSSFNKIEPPGYKFMHFSCPVGSNEWNKIKLPKSVPFKGIGDTIKEEKKEEVSGVTDYVSKDTFDAHLKRIDNNVTSVKEVFLERMSAMEERIDHRLASSEEKTNHNIEKLSANIANLASAVNRQQEAIESQRKEIHTDNLATRLSSYAVIATAIVGFIAIMVTLVR